MSRPFLSLELFGDRSTYIAEHYMEHGDDTFCDSVKKLMHKVIKTELTPTQRQVILEYYYNGKTVTQIADERGVCKSTVSRSLSAARERIGRALRHGAITLWRDDE